MSIDINTETSLTIAEKLLEQEHIINMQRIEILSQIITKLVERAPKLKKTFESELQSLHELENQLNDLENTTSVILS